MKRIAVKTLEFWINWVSPLYAWTHCCRFKPSCSKYAKEAYETHDLLKATKLSLWRLIRCNPFCKGGNDPVPKNKDGDMLRITRSKAREMVCDAYSGSDDETLAAIINLALENRCRAISIVGDDESNDYKEV